ncbi:MAG: hypothetical protein CMJ83_04090 [Planctomycetes bacterium]|nr:hypothetical protein [Planctomycetota bacterium]
MANREARCPLCRGTSFTYGQVGRGLLGHHPNRLYRFFHASTARYRGRAAIRSFVCTGCGYLGTYVDPADLERMRDQGRKLYNVRDQY